MRIVKLVVALVIATASTSVAMANIITNPGFESGMTGWTTNPSFAWGSSTQHVMFGSFDAVNGAGFNCGSTNCLDPTVGAYLYQDLATTVGTTYTVSFEYYFGGTSGLQEIDVYFGGNLDGNITTETNVPGWNFYSFDAVATSGTTRLEFTQVNDPDFTYLDNISADISTSSVPEPATTAMLAGGIGVLLLAKWRRR